MKKDGLACPWDLRFKSRKPRITRRAPFTQAEKPAAETEAQ